MTLFKFYGPPGTGKTHRLISRAKAYVRTGTPLYKIGYFAFTRKAASEARERMPADDKKLPFFQTLHSFAYHKLGLQEENIMQPYHYEDLGKRLGIRVNYADKFNDEQTHFLTCNDPYFQMIGRAMNRDITIREEFDRNEHDKKTIRWDTLKHIHANFLEYKSKNKLYDFNDIITNVCNRKDLPIFKTIFIDEAQDLSPLQWKLYDTLKKHTTDMYLAGDDDQAIFAWAGADVSRFINEKVDKEKVLKYSKRISKAIQEQSEIPLSRISGLRKHKVYPRNVEGSSKYITALNQVDLSKGKWLILARRKDTLLELMKELTKRNLYFETKKGKSFKVRIHKAASSYTNWTMDGMLEPKEIKNIQDYIPIGKWDPKKNWYEVFTLAPEKEVAYIRSMLENDEKLNEPARIFLSTIHAIKGGEEANVILSLELGNKIIKSMRRSKEKSDEEHRVWYVAITRGKNNLYKLKAKIARKGYPL